MTSTLLLEERGLFWWHEESIPDGHFAPNSSVAGILKIDEEGRIELELDGVMPSNEGAFSLLSGNGKSSKDIQGILKGGNKHVLLIDLIMNGGRLTSNGISYEKYLATNCLVSDSSFPQAKGGFHFQDLHIDLKGYEDWLRLGAIKTERTKSRLSANYLKPKDITYRFDGGELSVTYGISGPYFGKQNRDDLSLKECAAIIFRPTKSSSLDEMKAFYQLLQDLFILLTDSDYSFDWPTITFKKEKYQFYFLRYKVSAPPPKFHECWTNFPQLKEIFGQLFSAWMKKRESFGPGFYLYLGTRRGIKLYAEHRFVNLIWGIESLHRRKNPESPTSVKLDSKIKRILDQVSAEKDKCWLGCMLKNANEPSLEQRIFETFEPLQIGLDKDLLRNFSKECARIRNDISHFGGQRHDGNYRDFILKLEMNSEALSCLYHALLLQEIGVGEHILRWWFYEGYKSGPIKNTLLEAGLIGAPA